MTTAIPWFAYEGFFTPVAHRYDRERQGYTACGRHTANMNMATGAPVPPDKLCQQCFPAGYGRRDQP